MKKALFFTVLLIAYCHLSAENQEDTRKITWQEPKSQKISDKESLSYLYFNGATYHGIIPSVPTYYEKIKLKNAVTFEVGLTKTVFEPLSPEDIRILQKNNFNAPEEIKIKSYLLFDRKVPYAEISFVPIRKNKETGNPEKLVSFSLSISENAALKKTAEVTKTFALNSVLGNGGWYRIGVSKDGIFRLKYKDLQEMGVNVSSINPSDIRLFGNGGGMLPMPNAAYRRDDLVENAIYVQGEMDGKFDTTDYVLFYGQSPHRWKYNVSDTRFHHTVHEYSDTTYYFFTADARTDLGPAKRTGTVTSVSLPVTHTVTSFDDYQYHEYDQSNLIKSGRTWLGEYFDITTAYGFSFFFPNMDLSSPLWMKAEVAARNAQSSTFNVNTSGGSFSVITPYVDITCYYCPYASMASNTYTFSPSSSSVAVTVNKITSTAIGWLNYIELNARRNFIMDGEQMTFRDAASVGGGNVALFDFQSTSPVTIWEITDPVNAGRVNLLTGNNQFMLQTDSLREFIAFTGKAYESPSLHGAVPNQDLHSYAADHPDMVIVSHPLFLAQANALAAHHTSADQLKVVVVTPQQVYNEFSSGAQDVSAIRDFMKMLYDNATTPQEIPDYLLLFGDGSYDNKKRFQSNSNFIVSYQSTESFSYTTSYASDDFFGLLDTSEGDWDYSPGIVDIGVGRLPVRSAGEAQNMLDKIMKYTSTYVNLGAAQSCNNQAVCSSYGDWRNVVCFIADDEDQNLHFDQAQSLAITVENKYKNYNVDKIYLDSYVQQATPGGSRYPDANADFSRRMDKGALIVNYTGHGGELGLTHERVLEVADINSWKNSCNMPLLFTATCEFSRWDDPERTSAGEYAFLNPEGGGIALMSTSRLVFAGPNFVLNQAFYNYVFEKDNGATPRMGDVFRLTKASMSGSEINHRNFTLLGDPALTLAYPQFKVLTDSINSDTVGIVTYDTLSALGKVTISGFVCDNDSNLLSGYNGILYPTVFDKAATLSLLSNDDPLNSSMKKPFNLQENIIYKGKVGVKNGRFKFTFVVPKDISYQFGVGKISYYYVDSVSGKGDAHGAYQRVVIGGTSGSAVNDVSGPQVKLYMNDEKFVTGGTTDESPELYATVYDTNGINIVGNGIGHDITATLDADTKSSISLNDYYESDVDSFTSGKIRYPFAGLSEGRHTLKLKVWDVYNNSSDANTEFVVAKSAKLALEHVLNYPNPFTNKTKFYFEHNQACDELNVQIQVFTVSGKLVKTINTFVHSEGYRADPVDWDGKDDFGDKIGRGVYVYRVKVRNTDGQVAEKFEKLVILN